MNPFPGVPENGDANSALREQSSREHENQKKKKNIK
jgi:hypothetical protein